MMTSEESTIVLCEKPDFVTYDDIHNLLWEANAANRDSGFILATSTLSGALLEKRIGQDGYCFVALDGNKLAGILAVRFIERNQWYAKGTIPDYILAGVHPEYQGQHINSKLSDLVFRKLKELEYPLVELDTAENNEHAIKVYEHFGFKRVGFRPTRGGDHYSVIMVKWLSDCKFNDYYISFRYEIKKAYVKCRYLPNGRKRFGI